MCEEFVFTSSDVVATRPDWFSFEVGVVDDSATPGNVGEDFEFGVEVGGSHGHGDVAFQERRGEKRRDWRMDWVA